MRALAVALSVAFLLAGCASDEPDAEAAQTDDPNTTDDASDLETPQDVPEDEAPPAGETPEVPQDVGSAPVANLSADALTGVAPLTVTFTVNGTDADGDLAEWILSVNGEDQTTGTEFPSTAEVVLEEGSHVVSLSIRDEAGHVSWSNLTIDVEAGWIPFEATVDLDLPCAGCPYRGTSACTWRYHSNGAAQDCAWVELPDGSAGRDFFVTSSAGNGNILFWEGCDGNAGEKYQGEGDKTGVVPETADCALLWYTDGTSAASVKLVIS